MLATSIPQSSRRLLGRNPPALEIAGGESRIIRKAQLKQIKRVRPAHSAVKQNPEELIKTSKVHKPSTISYNAKKKTNK